MEAISLETTDDQFLIRVDKNSLKPEFVMHLIERLRVEQLAEKVNFNSNIEQLAEDIKAEWWNNNKSLLLETQK